MLPLGDLNYSSCPLHSTSTYACGVIIAPRMRSIVFVIMHIYRIGKWVFLITKFNVGV